VVESEPGTGRLAARPQVCAALVAAGVAVRHGRAGHHGFYLNREGLALRAELMRAAEQRAPEPQGPAEPTEPAAGGFVADDGSGAVPASPRRAAEVAAAWEGLLQIRSVLGAGAAEVPAPWERERAVHAVALALEAAGVTPARTDSPGYQVAPSPDPALPRITWTSPSQAPQALARIASLLPPLGWQPTLHRTRTATPYLLASPRRA
jgi:hypothetical protein